ncbi:ferredoxin [Amycolatopsis jejuensis]|uniref:ferredoxin n=1 Tax=Amycolatopsis jejuensis TaxID=330084 RepID=UPI0005246870|nr:ferredoxin [Amycolatopsis jejuensis]
MKVLVDIDACQGFACCMMEAPTVFDLEESIGKVVLLKEHPGEELRDAVAAAVRACPANALALEG